MSQVTWRLIPGEEGYEASSLGEVRSLDSEEKVLNRWGTITTRLRRGRILKSWVNSKGYHYLSLGAKNRKELHYWVATAFLGPRPKGLQVNHKDGDKSNNCPDNLEWVTRSVNVQHAFDNNLNQSGSKHGISKLTEKQVCEIKKTLVGKTKRKKPYYSDIAAVFGVDRKTIEAIAKNKNWRRV